jgi:hypothetical protein
VMIDDLIVSEDLNLVLFESLSMLLNLEKSQMIYTIDICYHFEILA